MNTSPCLLIRSKELIDFPRRDLSVNQVLLLDVPDMDTARVFMEQEPFYSNGVYMDINFHRWRFGRVMDRFK